MFEQIVDTENIDKALEYLLNGKDTFGTDGMYIHELQDYLNHNREHFVNMISDGKWQPGLVRLIDIVNKKGKIRTISSMNSIDKLVARCVFQVLEPLLESQFSDYSYAYRKDKGVDAAVKQARDYAEKYPYVVSVDFQNFFDSIDHSILISKIHQQFQEKRLDNLILKFLQLDIIHNGIISKTVCGILQGCSLSPLLANYYLNSFDQYMEEKEYPFLRYSDDCRIFSYNREEGEKILIETEKWVKEHLNLLLHQKKSKVAKVTEMEYFGKILKPENGGFVIVRKNRKPNNWYSEWTSSVLSFSNGIYHIREDGIFTAKDRNLIFENEETKRNYPIETISSINVFGNTIFDKSFFALMNQKHIDVVMFDQNGKHIGTFIPAESSSDVKLLIKQIQIYDDQSKRVAFGKSIISAGLKNMISTIRYYNKQHALAKYENVEVIMKQQLAIIRSAKTIEEIMTAEARCRQEYYDSFSSFITNDLFSFSKRTRRPPKDPVNAMMSFGNVYLYNRISSLITRSRLDNRISFVHSSLRRKNNLCLDLADIYKPITVDRVILTLINKHMIDPELHFSFNNDECRMNAEGVTVFLKEMKRKLGQKHMVKGKNTTYLQIIKNDIQTLASCIEEDGKFHPYIGE